jgi:hypothetical protein
MLHSVVVLTVGADFQDIYFTKTQDNTIESHSTMPSDPTGA